MFSSNRPKFAEFYADFKSEDKLKKTHDKVSIKKLLFASFLKYLFIGLLFLNFDFGFGISIKFCEFWYPY